MSKKTYYIITIGCQMNKSDSERIAGYLEKNGYKEARKRILADLVIINTCGVRQSAEDRVYGMVPRIKKDNPDTKIVLTGCLSERGDVKKKMLKVVDIWLPITEITKLNSKIINSDKIKNEEDRVNNYLNLIPKYNSKISAFVPIGNGCDNFCTYCVVPQARGREVYRAADEILKEVKYLVSKGYKEITLIAQNVNSYKTHITQHTSRNKKNTKIDFVGLLKTLNKVPGDFWVRFATSHPKDMGEDLIKTIADCGKVCEHIHLPVQAGDNGILKAMNRKYTVVHYKNLIKKIREIIPGVSITTDVIVGFPGETKIQFNNTKKLFKEVKFDMAYIAQYSPRPGTVAAKLMDDITKKEKKRREEELMKILRKTALENNKKYIGKTIKVLIEGKNKKGELYGRTRSNKVVKVKITDNRPAVAKAMTGKQQIVEYNKKFVKIKIKNAKDFGLEGIIISG